MNTPRQNHDFESVKYPSYCDITDKFITEIAEDRARMLSKQLYAYEQAIEMYGKNNQVDVAIEEMAELTQALIHNRRGRPSNIPEEIADVEIMLEQLKIIFQCRREVAFQKEKKIKRLLLNLKKEEE